MNFPDLSTLSASLSAEFSRRTGVGINAVRVVASPYRICPLGAHIDHQGGPVLGMTINAYTLLAYTPLPTARIELESLNFPGKISFDIANIPPLASGDWGNYPRCIVRALRDDHRLDRGIVGLVSGTLPGCGLSSSASVLLAYMHALADVNCLTLSPWECVHLTRRAENTYFGLRNGILDQTSIVFGQRHHLVHIDTRREQVEPLLADSFEEQYRILVAFSGYSRELLSTGYNSRVQECREAAAILGQQVGIASAEILSDVPEHTLTEHGGKLPENLRRRATHFFSEVRRVNQGTLAWQAGKFDEFGALMFDSCRSSIEQYECGSLPVQTLQQIMHETDGLIGARFNGGGFGGCVTGFVERDKAKAAAAHIAAQYRIRHPEAAGKSAVYLADSAHGARVL